MRRDLPFWTRVEGHLTGWSPLRQFITKYHQQRKKLAMWRARRRDRRSPTDLRNFERQIYSQYGEDGVIAEIFRRIGEGGKFAVEFGIEDGTECNTRHLFEDCGWSGLLIDGSPEYVASARALYAGRPVEVMNRFITVENILEIFREGRVPRDFDLLSIDIDGNDYWIWEKITTAYRPRVVVIEYNGRWAPPREWVIPYDPDFRWDGSVYYGASLESMARLGASRAYRLVGCSFAGLNAFFVRDDHVGDHFPTAGRGAAYHYTAPLYQPGFGPPVLPDVARPRTIGPADGRAEGLGRM
jgi:hypothetical protein